MKKHYWLDSIGKLSQHPDVPDEWLIGDATQIPFFDNEDMEFTFQVDLETDKDVLKDADLAISNFLDKNESDRLNCSNQVYLHYKEINDYWESDPELNLPSLKINEENDIWTYVYPGSITVCRGDNEDESIYLIITCGCEWEKEHGLQLVFKNGKELTKVSIIDYSTTE